MAQVLVIGIAGGSGSGKSEYAEQTVVQLGALPRLYIATMYPFDEECHRRIQSIRRCGRKRDLRHWSVIRV